VGGVERGEAVESVGRVVEWVGLLVGSHIATQMCVIGSVGKVETFNLWSLW
jgi:hypothetical protein